MKKYFMPRIFQYFTLAITILLFAGINGCTQTEDPCGPNDSKISSWDTSTDIKANQLVLEASKGLDGTNRYYRWNHIVENVCPDKHAQVEISVHTVAQAPRPISVAGEVNWSANRYRQVVPVTNNSSGGVINWEGSTPSGGIGLKQAYDTEPASFISYIEISFETFGSGEADDDFVKENVLDILLQSFYNLYK